MIDISGLDKVAVLYALYNASHTQGLGFINAVPNYTYEDCKKDFEASKSKYFDYLHGRVLKVDLSGDEFDPRLYDRDCGEGAAYYAIEELRSK
jgi:hypothetical protein